MLQINKLKLTHQKDFRVLLEDFSMTINSGDKVVLIGEEGNGKSTLLKWIADPAMVADYVDAEGNRVTNGEVTAFLPQELSEAQKELSVRDYFSAIPVFLAADPAERGRLASSLGFSPALFEAERPMGTLSGGERIKLQMAGILMGRPDILLLDEPSNDIDIQTLAWMEKMIRQFPGSVLFVSHDETLIERTANRVVLLEQLRHKQIPRVTVANMPFREFMEERSRAFSKQAKNAASERREERKAKERFHRIQQAVEHAQDTISRADPAGGRLLKKKMKAVKSMERRYARDHEQMTEMPEMETAITIRLDRQQAMPAGKTVLDMEIPELTSPSGEKLATNLSLFVRGPEKLCIIGRNGCGKTTLLRAVAGELTRRGDLKACYMPQNYEEVLPMDSTPVAYLAPSGKKEEVTQARTYLGSMKYTQEEMLHPIRELSGGQKAKLLLLKMSLTEANVLILDEPTRNFSPLSAPEIRAILADFPGAIISVSHDRKFITEVCDKVYELTEAGFRQSEMCW